MDREPIAETQAWPLRAPLLLALGAGIGLMIHLLTRGEQSWLITENPLRLGAAAALAAGGIVFAVSLDRTRWPWSAWLAAGAGAVAGFVVGWNGSPDHWGAGEGWQLVAALLAIGIAVPIFQASRDVGRWNLDYRAVHAYAWTDAVLWAVACGFTLLTWLLLNLLAELFRLIGIDALRDLLGQSWFGWMALCGALGAAIGLLRERDSILALLQRVATAILSVLAPILAAGLVVFVLALPFTGLEPLWEQTRATTPILLACILGAVVLINAAIGRDADEEARSRVVRWAAAALAAVTLPLAIVAAVSTGKRIAQHGFTPDRLWAAVFVAITVLGAAAYLLALVRGRAGWPALLRTMNLRLAIGIGLVALFLALPIVNFGALSTRDQLARLESGRIAPEKFDWAALRYDFGPAGRAALKRLEGHSNGAIAGLARLAAKAESRWDMPGERARDQVRAEPLHVRALPAGTAVPPPLASAIAAGEGSCGTGAQCTVYLLPNGQEALVFDGVCYRGGDESLDRCGFRLYTLRDGEWTTASPGLDEARRARIRSGYESGAIEVRSVPARQAYVGGQKVGEPF